jgi:GNAT superfamily N-acetyltransferase
MATITIREIAYEEAAKICYPLLYSLNPDMTEANFQRLLKIVTDEGEVMVGLFEDGKLAALVGYWLAHQFWCDKFLEPDNLIVLPEHRGKNYGRKLMEWLENRAAELDCKLVLLKSYKANEPATKFYEKLEYTALGNVFLKPLGTDNRKAFADMLAARNIGQKSAA